MHVVGLPACPKPRVLQTEREKVLVRATHQALLRPAHCTEWGSDTTLLSEHKQEKLLCLF